jgi:3-oxoacyl-[acyl-carrier-protein] synthase-3
MKPPLGIRSIGATLGSVRTENISKYPGEMDLDFLKSVVGILQTYHKRPEQNAVDLCVEAFADLQKSNPIQPSEIDLVIVVSQHTRPNIPPLSASLSGRLGLKEADYCLDLSIGCTGFVQGAQVLSRLMLDSNYCNALLFNVETLSEVLAPADVNTNLIFSDAASACLFTRENFLASFTAFDFATSGSQCLALHAQNSQLAMDGLAIYNFVARKVPPSLHALLGRHGLSAKDLNAIFFHQASLRTVNKVRESFVSEVAKIPYDILEYGNTGSCTIPFLLRKHLPSMTADPKKHFMLSSFGSGLSYANALMKMD